jgi:endonuclease/exonuclease/phosphatase family metal-dependent hydrolase
MYSPKKSHVVIGGILIGFAVSYQDELRSIWNGAASRLAAFQRSPDPSVVKHDGWQGGATSPAASAAHSGGVVSEEKFRSNASFSVPQEVTGPSTVFLTPPGTAGRMISSKTDVPPGDRTQPAATLRIASFNLHGLGESKLRQVSVAETIVRILRQFDVIALQHIQSRQQHVLPELIDRLNQSDRRYEYCIGPRVGSAGNEQQFAFVFDTDRVETDRQMLYTVDDPQRLMEYDPLVGWFRSRMAPSNQAFTFSLVNMRIDPLNSEQEWARLPDLIRSIRQDGRQEDDILLAGDFSGSQREMTALPSAGMMFALDDTPTAVTGDAMLDNIIFPSRATDEFTGRAGVVDFLRQGNLSIDQALQVSSHMPIWAEFTVTEGGRFGLRDER